MNDGIVVVGAGGHAKVILSAAMECGLRISFIIDDDEAKWGKEIFGIKVKGPISAYKNSNYSAIVAIGDNETRKKMVDNLIHFEWITIIHPHAYVHKSAIIGKGTVIFAGAVIQPDVIIGTHCIINTGSTVDHDCRIGNFVHVAPGVNIAGGVTIGEGSFLGIGSKVIFGKRIGEWTVVGAGSVVAQDIPSKVLSLGVPAKIKKQIKKEL
jgi:sugar O-acyltransferase (sialic acid O-acetyltransferase NeuD family)